MTRLFLLRSTALAALVAVPAAAPAQNVSIWDLFTAERIGTGMVQSLVSLGRSFAEIRYVDLDIRPLDNHYMIGGITIAPYDLEDYPGCEIVLDRFVLSGASLLQTDVAAVNVEIAGGTVPVTCFDPFDRQDLVALGIETLTIDHGVIRLEMEIASGAASLDFDLQSAGYGTLTGEVAFDYFSFNFDSEEPVADLASAHVEFTDDGLWALFSDQVPPFIANEEMLVTLMSEELLSTPPLAIPEPPLIEEAEPPAAGGKPGDSPTAEPAPIPALPPAAPPEPVADADMEAARAVIEDLAQAVAGFAAEPGRIAVEIAPETPVRLTEELFDDFTVFATALNPSFEHGPRPEVAAAPEMVAALAAALAGEAVSDSDRRDLGLMLLRGAGVPRSPGLAIEVMEPLLAAGDAEALAALSDHHDLVPPAQVYGFLHAAAAGGNTEAALALDQAERRLGLAGVLEAQGASRADLTGAESPADLEAMARAALSGTSGSGRHYHDAYLYALLAEAGGETSAGFLVDTLDDRARISDDPTLWEAMLEDARSAALAHWVEVNAVVSDGEAPASETDE